MGQFFESISSFFSQSGFAGLTDWRTIIMLLISFVLLFLAIVKKFEPLLLLPIAFGMLLTNLPMAEMYHPELFAGGHVHWEMFSGATILNTGDIANELRGMLAVYPTGEIALGGNYLFGKIVDVAVTDTCYINNLGQLVTQAGEVVAESAIINLNTSFLTVGDSAILLQGTPIATEFSTISAGLLDYLYLGVKLGIYPCLIFFGVGAMTDFEPLIANPKSLLLGAAAQIGIFITFIGAMLMGFDGNAASSIGIIGGADGPTAIYTTSILKPELLGPIAVAAYSYMALVPVIQPPIMKLLTTKKERQIVMKPLRTVSKREKIIFPIAITVFVALLVPSAAPLVGSLMLGNLFKESGVTERLSKTVQNELMNIVTIFLGVTVGATATAEAFLKLETLKILAMGIVAFAIGSGCGVLLAKFMNLFTKNKINPLIGSAGVSAVPMAARVSQTVGQKENPSNFLLMHAMGPNVAGVIGSAIAAGVLIAIFG